MSNVATYIVEQLYAWGVRRIYGVSGSETIPLFDAIHNHQGIDLITVRHESAAGFMASTEAKCTGGLAVCITTAGPGLTNLLNGIADASFDHVPVLVLSGQLPTKKIGTHAKQYLNQQMLISPFALYSEMVTHADATRPLLLKAMQCALLQKGVTHLSIPLDLQTMTLTNEKIVPFPASLFDMASTPDGQALQRVRQRIMQSERPLLMAGVGARNAAAEILQLSKSINAGIISSLGAKGMFSEQYPFHIGSLGDGGSEEAHALLQEADLLIVIGSTWYPAPYIPSHLPIIQIDLNPNHIALQNQIADFLIGRAEEIIPKLLTDDITPSHESWSKRVRSVHEQFISRMHRETAIHPKEQTSHPAHIMGTLSKHIPENAVVLVDTGEHTIWFNRYFTGNCKRVLISGKWRSMGYALPAANAVQLLYPDLPVVAVIGDGSFLMSLSECSTTMRYQLPIKVIVMNNHALILEERKSVESGYQPSGTELTNPDFAKLVEAFGWRGIKVKKESELEAAIQELMNSNVPTLLDIDVSQDMPRNIKPD